MHLVNRKGSQSLYSPSLNTSLQK